MPSFSSAMGFKMKMELGIDSAMEQTSMSGLSVDPFYIIRDIKKASDNGKTVYTILYALPNLSGMINSVSDSALKAFDTDIDISIGDMIVKIMINEDGSLSGMTMSMNMEASMTVDGETTAASYKYEMDMKIVAVGDSVSIVFPSDLDEYLSFGDLDFGDLGEDS